VATHKMLHYYITYCCANIEYKLYNPLENDSSGVLRSQPNDTSHRIIFICEVPYQIFLFPTGRIWGGQLQLGKW